MSERLQPFEISSARASDTLTFKVRGIVTSEGISDALRREMSETPVNNIVWDLSQASLSSLQPDELSAIATCAKQFEPMRSRPRTAIIVSSSADAVFMRLYEAVAEKVDLHTTFRIVDSQEEALAWIAEDTSAPAD